MAGSLSQTWLIRQLGTPSQPDALGGRPLIAEPASEDVCALLSAALVTVTVSRKVPI